MAIRSDRPGAAGRAPTLRIPIVEHHVTWHRVIDPPWDAIRAAPGTVNDCDFMGGRGRNRPLRRRQGHREFTGLDDFLQPQFGWAITYVFREKAIKVLDAGDGRRPTVGTTAIATCRRPRPAGTNWSILRQHLVQDVGLHHAVHVHSDSSRRGDESEKATKT